MKRQISIAIIVLFILPIYSLSSSYSNDELPRKIGIAILGEKFDTTHKDFRSTIATNGVKGKQIITYKRKTRVTSVLCPDWIETCNSRIEVINAIVKLDIGKEFLSGLSNNYRITSNSSVTSRHVFSDGNTRIQIDLYKSTASILLIDTRKSPKQGD